MLVLLDSEVNFRGVDTVIAAVVCKFGVGAATMKLKQRGSEPGSRGLTCITP